MTTCSFLFYEGEAAKKRSTGEEKKKLDLSRSQGKKKRRTKRRGPGSSRKDPKYSSFPVEAQTLGRESSKATRPEFHCILKKRRI